MASAATGMGIAPPCPMGNTQRSDDGLASHPNEAIQNYMNQGLPPLERSHNETLIQDRQTEVLAKSYYEAMQEFTDRANQYAESTRQPDSNKHCVAKVENLSDITEGGLNGESLAMRGCLVYEGEPDTIQTLAVLTGGLHGSEARIAIKTQCDLLQRISEEKQQLPANTALLFIPDVNPWGGSYSDRCNQSNVDPNRNFPTSDRAYKLHPSGHLATVWEEMNSFMNPPEEQAPIKFYLKLIGKFIKYLILKLISREGNPMPAAIAGGQNRDPQKLFYGGNHPETNTQAVIKMFNESLALFPKVTTVFHNDDHTGLAKKGAHSVEVKASSPLLEERVADAIRNRLSGCTIPQGYQVERPSARQVFYPIDGDITDWFMRLKGRDGITDVISICQEVGTTNSILGSEPPALQALSAALWRKNHSDLKTPEGLTQLFWTPEYAHVRETFCPDDDTWAEQGLYNYRNTTEALLELLQPEDLYQAASHGKPSTSTSDHGDEVTMKLKTA